MDLELLNFWIRRLHYEVRGETLFINLSAFEKDYMYSYALELSSDSKRILDFFGFDTSIEYDKLTLSNQFEFLCSSTKLNPHYITYSGFKWLHPKNHQHSKFNQYLVKRYYHKKYKYPVENIESNNFSCDEAILFFQKEKEYRIYEKHELLINTVLEKKFIIENESKTNHKKFASQFNMFLLVHGMNSVSSWDNQKCIHEFQEFVKEKWSGLNVFRI